MLETLDDYKRDLEATKLVAAAVQTLIASSGTSSVAVFREAKPGPELLRSSAATQKLSGDSASQRSGFLLRDVNLVGDIRQLARFEGLVGSEENHVSLALHHSVIAERVLRTSLLERSHSIARIVVEAHETPGQRKILEGYYAEKHPPTLGIVELFGVGLRRCLKSKHRGVHDWVDTYFSRNLRQACGGSPKLVRTRLADEDFARFVSDLRLRIRNPAAHGRAFEPIHRAQYEDYCRSAYGHAKLEDWVKTGLKKPGDQGSAWIAMISITAKAV